VIRTFSSVSSFLESSNDIKRDCPIYLDLNISGEKSINYLGRFEALGFRNIILATGEDISLDGLPKIVQAISGKLPPK
jgi:hypothetical protein